MEKSPDAFRTISEVADFLETPAHVLRFWETRFPQVRPVKRAGGRRYYRPSDVALLSGIRQLLHDQGMTIRGVQKILREQGVKHVCGLGALPEAADLAEAWPEGLGALIADPGDPEGEDAPDAPDDADDRAEGAAPPEPEQKPVVLTLVASDARHPEPVFDLFSRLDAPTLADPRDAEDRDPAGPDMADRPLPDTQPAPAVDPGAVLVSLRPDLPETAEGDPGDGDVSSVVVTLAPEGEIPDGVEVAGQAESTSDGPEPVAVDLAQGDSVPGALHAVAGQGADPVAATAETPDPDPNTADRPAAPPSDPEPAPLSRRLVIEVPAARSDPAPESVKPDAAPVRSRGDVEFAGPTRSMRLRRLPPAVLAQQAQGLRAVQARLAALRGRMAQAARLRKP